MSKTQCKICGGETTVFGQKLFTDLRNESDSYDVTYHRCSECGFIFTSDFDHWSKEEFSANIYNEDYIKVDPDYVEKRPTLWVHSIARKVRKDESVLDYGAGNDVLASKLRRKGYDVVGWDPMWGSAPEFGDKKFDVVVSIEVLEHTPTPLETVKEIVSFLKPGGRIIMSTLLNDVIKDEGVDYWYIAPRNGHVCMHSKKSLDILFSKVGMNVRSESNSVHTIMHS